MVDPELPLESLRTLIAVADDGSFEAAAGRLRVSQPAVSQRIKGLEQRVGRVLVIRSKPLRLTESGETMVRFARQVLHLERDVLSQLDVAGAGDQDLDDWRQPVPLAVAVNSDSLASWFLDALMAVPPDLRLSFRVYREDQERTSQLLRSGTVCAAVTTDTMPVNGCASQPLGHMVYRALARPEFAARWIDGKPIEEVLTSAPVVIFDQDDDLQHRFMRQLNPSAELSELRHYIPDSESYLRAVELGLGWGMVPDELARRLAPGAVVDLAPGKTVRVALNWQEWKLNSVALATLSAAVIATAYQLLS